MKIVWDELKRLANLDKHGLDFAELTESFFEDALIVRSRGNRFRGIGLNNKGIVCVVFARMGREAVSVISMRPASVTERKLYAQAR
jgi:uncharacterized DUF497 family protein